MPAVILGGVTIDPGPQREIRLGGTQALVKKDVPGAGPHYQDMGTDEERISWNGTLVGPTAVETARSLEGLRVAGKAVELLTSIVPPVKVRIRSFEYRLVRSDRVEYDIGLVTEGVTPDFTPPTEQVDAGVLPASPASGSHIVVAGDTLYALAQRYLGDGSLWPAIATANSITDPAALQVGQVLVVPTASEAGALAATYQERTSVRDTYLQAVLDAANARREAGGAG